MRERVRVMEPPQHGKPSQCRYHLLDSSMSLPELIGWTNDAEEAQDWLLGFGPVTTASVEDRRSWVKQP